MVQQQAGARLLLVMVMEDALGRSRTAPCATGPGRADQETAKVIPSRTARSPSQGRVLCPRSPFPRSHMSTKRAEAIFAQHNFQTAVLHPARQADRRMQTQRSEMDQGKPGFPVAGRRLLRKPVARLDSWSLEGCVCRPADPAEVSRTRGLFLREEPMGSSHPRAPLEELVMDGLDGMRTGAFMSSCPRVACGLGTGGVGNALLSSTD
jgi:hypothetical protein